MPSALDTDAPPPGRHPPVHTPCRGTWTIDGAGALRGSEGHLADTYLDTHGWGKGVAWVNGFNLGW